MFKKKDVIRTLFLLLVMFVIVLTLSQILVVHRRNHHKSKSRDSKRFQTAQAMVLRVEKNIEAMMKKNFLPPEKHREYLLSVLYSERIKNQLTDLSSRNKEIRNKNNFMDNSYAAFKERKLRFHEFSESGMLLPGTRDNRFQEFIEAGANRFTDTVKLLFDDDNNTSDGIVNTGDVKRKLHVDETARRKTLTKKYHSLSDNRQRIVLPQCQETPDGLEGNLHVTQTFAQNDNVIKELFADIKSGGSWKPSMCVARQRTAIILPYRNRENHLKSLLRFLIPVLKRQLLDFRIFVVEQFGNRTFNKGRLMNAGFMEAWTLWNFDCVIFHDVDLLPENDRNMYTCGMTPRHMSIAVDKFRYKLPYLTLVGGVFSINREHFLKVNGYSNLYWGWGAEDDDMAHRLKTVKLGIERPPANIGRYKMIKHDNRETIPVKMRAYLLKTVRKRYHRDGLNTLDYKVVSINCTQLYTNILVDIGEPPLEAADINNLLN